LWSEYAAAAGAQAYRYSQFCERYRRWVKRQRRSLRQVHRAGEKLFVDYCGPTVGIVDASSGEQREAQIFVAVLGPSNYTYAEATWTQSLPDWIGSHQRALGFFGGVPTLLVPDYVFRHIIVVLCLSPLCGGHRPPRATRGRRACGRTHNRQSDSSHFSTSGSRRQTLVRGDCPASGSGGVHSAMAASFMRMLTSA
jgi:hypothetical protein